MWAVGRLRSVQSVSLRLVQQCVRIRGGGTYLFDTAPQIPQLQRLVIDFKQILDCSLTTRLLDDVHFVGSC